MDMMDGIIMGAASAAIGSVIAYVVINKISVGGGSPPQPNVAPTTQFGRTSALSATYSVQPSASAPLASNIPITEAAYSIDPQTATYTPPLGTSNDAAQEAILPF